MLEIKNLHVKAEDKEILKGVDLLVKPGELVVLMGPNGSGKSTLAYALAGHPLYKIVNSGDKNSKVMLDGVEVTALGADERSAKGLFLVNQYPVAIPGLASKSFLWRLYKKHNPTSPTTLGQFRKWIEAQAEQLGLKKELLERGVNEGFSGGEKKKMEILQLLVSNPKYIIIDEVDSGLDVDALKKIATTIGKMAKELKIGVLLITHYSRVFSNITVDRVLILRDGKVEKTGGMELVNEIETEGFGHDQAANL